MFHASHHLPVKSRGLAAIEIKALRALQFRAFKRRLHQIPGLWGCDRTLGVHLGAAHANHGECSAELCGGRWSSGSRPRCGSTKDLDRGLPRQTR